MNPLMNPSPQYPSGNASAGSVLSMFEAISVKSSSYCKFLGFCGKCWSSQRNVISEHWSLKSSQKKTKKSFDLENLGQFFARKAAACRYWTWTLRKRISRISNRKSALVSSDRWKMMVIYIVNGKGSGWFRMMDGIFLRLEEKRWIWSWPHVVTSLE